MASQEQYVSSLLLHQLGLDLVAVHTGDYDRNPKAGFPKNLGKVEASDVVDSKLAIHSRSLDDKDGGERVDTVAWRYEVVRDGTVFSLYVDVTTGKMLQDPVQEGIYGGFADP